jgi:hypothetical protein
MAKRISQPKSESNPGSQVVPSRKTRGSRARAGREVASEMTTGQEQAARSDEFVGVAHTGEQPLQRQASHPTASSSMSSDPSEESMSSDPSEEDVRLRAYQRYLERGGGDGMDFEDWLEAERELKPRH